MPHASKKYLIGGVAILIVLLMSVFQVMEGNKALLKRFGRLITSNNGAVKVYEPGLHFKIPFIEQSMSVDVRLQTMTGNQETSDMSRFLTAEQKYVLVDYFVKWRVVDIPKYYKAVTDKRRAEMLLKQRIDDALRAAFGERTINEVVSGQRSDVMDLTRTAVEKTGVDLGIEVVDVRIKRIDLPREVSEAVYSRMRAERQRIAASHRAAGKEKAEAISASADKEVVVLIASAEREAAQLKAEGRAQAARIYAEAYSKDSDFYAFMRSLIAYEKTFSTPQDVLVLQPDFEFFDYFKSDHAKK